MSPSPARKAIRLSRIHLFLQFLRCFYLKRIRWNQLRVEREIRFRKRIPRRMFRIASFASVIDTSPSASLSIHVLLSFASVV